MSTPNLARGCVLGLALILVPAAQAQPYTVRYEAATGLLPNNSCPAWTLEHTGGATSLAGGVLTISGGTQNHVLCYHVPVSFASPVVVEFRARRLTGTTSSAAREQLGIAIGTATNHGILFFVGPDVAFLTNGQSSRGPQAFVDTDLMHTYRIEVLGSVVRVFYDGAQILTGSTYSSGEFPSAGITWGDFTNFADGASEWEYVQHNSSATPCVPPACEPAPSGAVSWWPGDGNANDIVGPHEGSLLNGAGFGPGRVGQAFSLDGANDEVAITHTSALDVGTNDSFTIDAWLKPSVSILGTHRVAVSLTYVCSAEVIILDLLADGRIHFQIRDSNNISVEANSPSSIVDGQWHHVAAVRNVGSDRVELYLDGSLVDSRPDITTGRFSRANAQDRIGSIPVACPSNRYFWAGGIDEVEFFRRGLTAAEIAVIVNAGAAGHCRDGGPPTVTAPADASYPCAAQVPAAAPEQATATDDQGVVSLTVTESSNGGAGSPSSPLVLTRTWTATDAAGNSASDSQIITVVDDTPPVLAIPADLATTTGPGIEPCADVRLALEAGTATATDNCGTPTVALSGAPEGGLFPVGETLLIWTATDPAGNVVRDTQRVVVTCPVGDVVGSASLVCNGATEPAANVTVRLLHEGSPFLSTTTGPGGDYRFDDLRLGTYTVDIDPPPGYAVSPDTRTETLAGNELGLEPFLFTCLLSDLTGQVLGTCTGQTTGLQGVTVDVYGEDSEGMDVLIATTGTDATGHYRFDDLALGDYTVGVVLPLGYATASAAREVTLATADGSLAAEAFTLACQVITAEPRAMGYWKHQVNAHLTGKGQAQESLTDLLRYVDELVIHFNQNLINPVIVYVPGSGGTHDKLLQLQQLLTVNRGGTALDRAKQQLLALLLNVVAGKISQTEVISDNGATVSQAITHSHDLIVDGNPGNDPTAQTIGELINGGQRVPSGMVPTSTRVITYDQRPAPREPLPAALSLGPIAPNPATLDASITFALPSDAPASLEVVDLAGRMVSRLAVGARGAGIHTFRLTELGSLRPGVYLIRLSQGRESLIQRLAVIR